MKSMRFYIKRERAIGVRNKERKLMIAAVLFSVLFTLFSMGFVNFQGSVDRGRNEESLLIPPQESVPLTLNRLEQKTQDLMVPESEVKPGYRAVSFTMDNTNAEEGLVRPGSRIDVVFTHVNRQGELRTDVVAENARVMAAVDHENSNESTRQKRKTITVVIRSEEALPLIRASALTSLGILIRPENDMQALPLMRHEAESISDKPAPSDIKSKSIVDGYCPTTTRSVVPVGTRVCTKHCNQMQDLMLSGCYR